MQNLSLSGKLPLQRVRELHLQSSPREDAPPFLSAASGLARVGDRYHVVADDAVQLASFSAGNEEPGELKSLFERPPLPAEEKARKAVKPDLEALTQVKTETGSALLAIGSGSTPQRNSGVFVPLNPDGSTGQPVEFDLSPLYGRLRHQFPELNIEGAAPVEGKLRLLQRGNGSSGPNAVIDLNLSEVVKAAQAGQPISENWLETVKPADLGTTPGFNGPVPWTFTDLTPLGEGRSLFTAAAEDTDNPYDDGEVLGSALGFLDADGTVSALYQVEQKVKLEGVSAKRQDGKLEATLVTDADDPHKPATMYRVELPFD